MKNFALGRLPVGQMNKTEIAYATVLEGLKRAGQVQWYRFEGLKLRLADSTFYTPDFAVMRDDGVMECHEVKGFWQGDARVKIKVAAEMYPFRFMAVKRKKGGWEYEVFGSVASASISTAGEENDRDRTQQQRSTESYRGAY